MAFTAAHNPDGRSAAILDLARAGRCEVVASPHAVEEARRNLEIKYPEAMGRLKELLGVVVLCGECSSERAEWARLQSLPDKDAPILGAAVQCRADLLVTGDRTHFHHLYGRSVEGVKVVTPGEALGLVLQAGSEGGI